MIKNDGYIIDWLAITIKPDVNVVNCQEPTLGFVYSFLDLESADFADIGGGNRYAERYTCNNITVSVAPEKRFDDMGIHICFTSKGLRYYEQLQRDGEFISCLDFWREFFTRLRRLNAQGYAINVSRIDIAKDDYDGVLNMAVIERCARRGEFVSRFRTAHKVLSIEGLTDSDRGHTITFGSRQSNTFLRFYDKKQEQLSKCQDDEYKRELESLEHWNRMEFEFKDTNAIKVVNLICDSKSFGDSFAEIVNGYIRFIDLDKENKSTCKMQKWWGEFVGTLTKARLTVSQYISYSAKKTKKYFDKCLAPTVYTVFATNDVEEIMLSLQAGGNRLKRKHIDIINGSNFKGVNCYQELWNALRSVPVSERVAYEC
jgi:phage replication initiation protein